jgi:hypothetical protein
MKNLGRRIGKVEAKLNREPDADSWWEDFKARDPQGAQIREEFFDAHRDDPEFQKEEAEGKWSDETINQFADHVLKRTYELMPSKPKGRL